MIAAARICCTILALAAGRAVAQQQTGSAAGIPIPSVAAAPNLTGLSPAVPSPAVFRVRVLDGRNGLPIRNAHVKLWYDEPAGMGYELATAEKGYGDMPAPVGEPVRVLLAAVGYTDCRKQLHGDPAQGYSMSSIATTGVATQNTCGPVTVRTHPGELVLFVRPAHWYEGLNRTTGN